MRRHTLKLTSKQLQFRTKLQNTLVKAQTAFYEGKPIDRAKVVGMARGFATMILRERTDDTVEKSRVLYPSELRKIELWVEYWGDTLTGEPADLSIVWDHQSHPCNISGAMGGTAAERREVREEIEQLRTENAELREEAAA